MIRFSETKTLSVEQRTLLKRGLSGITIGELLEQVEDNQGNLFLVHDDEELVGVFYVQVFDEVLTVRTMSGKRLKTWSLAMEDFLVTKMQEYSLKEFWIFSRRGWNKFFPRLKFEGAVYSFKMGGGLPSP